jgi:hypothetical protein
MQLDGYADFYVLLFGVVYLAWCDFEKNPIKISIKFLSKSRKSARPRPWQWLDKRSGQKAWAEHGQSKLTGPKKARQVKSKVNSKLIIFFDIKGIVHI